MAEMLDLGAPALDVDLSLQLKVRPEAMLILLENVCEF